MDEYKKLREWAIQQIKDNRVYVESVQNDVGNRIGYDFLICRVEDGRPLIWAPFIYDSKEDALHGGYLLALRTQQQGNLERIAA